MRGCAGSILTRILTGVLGKEKYKLESWKCENSYIQEGLKDYKVSDLYKRPNRSVYNVNVGNYIYGLTSRSRIFHLYGDVTIAGEGLQSLSLCSVLRAFEQGGIFIVPHLL
jgi:hypothetical protein